MFGLSEGGLWRMYVLLGYGEVWRAWPRQTNLQYETVFATDAASNSCLCQVSFCLNVRCVF